MQGLQVIAGSRRSELAVRQTRLVLDAIQAARSAVRSSIRFFDTLGDRTIGALVPPPGGKGLFTAELERALLAEEIDLAVHSLKDLPVVTTPELAIAAVPKRASARDVIVGRKKWTLDTLPGGASVGTSSPRRAAQVRHYRKDIEIRPIRGNVGTRITKMERGDVDALVLAEAGLNRLERDTSTATRVPLDVMLPAPGQGALAVQCRATDKRMMDLLAALDCSRTRLVTTTERLFLRALGGGCASPVGAFATADEYGAIDLRGAVLSTDGSSATWVYGTGSDPAELGPRLAKEVLERKSKEESKHA